MKELLFSSGNEHKIVEIKALLPAGYKVVYTSDETPAESKDFLQARSTIGAHHTLSDVEHIMSAQTRRFVYLCRKTKMFIKMLR